MENIPENVVCRIKKEKFWKQKVSERREKCLGSEFQAFEENSHWVMSEQFPRGYVGRASGLGLFSEYIKTERRVKENSRGPWRAVTYFL